MPLDFDALTPAQEAAVHNVAMSQEGAGHHPKVLARLVAKGFITEREVRLPGRLPITIKVYDMPIHVHVQWAEWCSRKVNEEQAAAKGGEHG